MNFDFSDDLKQLRDQARRVAETLLDHEVLSETMPPMVVTEYMI